MYRNRKANVPVFNTVLDSMFNNEWDKFFHDDNWSNTTAPVNIKETDTSFQLDLIAPGLSKEDFNISVEKNILKISFEHKKEKPENNDKVIRNEYHYSSFKRSFTVGENINTSDVNASYKNGVLNISLPKKEAKKEITHKIEVA